MIDRAPAQQALRALEFKKGALSQLSPCMWHECKQPCIEWQDAADEAATAAIASLRAALAAPQVCEWPKCDCERPMRCGKLSVTEAAALAAPQSTEREAFEAWAKGDGYGQSMLKTHAWQGWQARAALSAQPEGAAPTQPDKGPWSVQEWSHTRVVLMSDDFTHDVALEISGDFADHNEKLWYANALATSMNAPLYAPLSASPQAPATAAGVKESSACDCCTEPEVCQAAKVCAFDPAAGVVGTQRGLTE
jgi:hypothetical protein